MYETKSESMHKFAAWKGNVRLVCGMEEKEQYEHHRVSWRT